MTPDSAKATETVALPVQKARAQHVPRPCYLILLTTGYFPQPLVQQILELDPDVVLPIKEPEAAVAAPIDHIVANA